jgi:anti-sigma regulatory factor (Ser/Thr protein kinase)
MEEHAARVELEPEPLSASAARLWVQDTLGQIGRNDLVESATAGVSELVTNAILHAQTAISVVLQNFGERVVITVTDRAPVHTQSRFSPDAPREEDSTVGRGLGIVRAFAEDWGVVSSTHGKSIWFVPAAAPHALEEFVLPEIELLGEEEPSESDPDGPRVAVEMVDAPVEPMMRYQDRWTELVRELQLIALGEPSPLQAIAAEVCDIVPLTRAQRWMAEDSVARLAAAHEEGRDRVRLTLEVPLVLRDTYIRLRELLARLVSSASHDELLYLTSSPTSSPQFAQLRDCWFLEVIGQLGGAEPTPWRGSFVVEEDSVQCE